MNAPKCPPGLGAAGRRFWKSITESYELEPHEQLLLGEVCRSYDTAQMMAAALADAPTALVEGSQGQPRANPLLAELRQERALVAKLAAQLRIPIGDESAMPQRRAGFRGPRGVA